MNSNSASFGGHPVVHLNFQLVAAISDREAYKMIKSSTSMAILTIKIAAGYSLDNIMHSQEKQQKFYNYTIPVLYIT